MAHCHHTQIKIRNTQRINQSRVSCVSDFCIGHITHGFLYFVFILINDQHLMMKIGQFLRHMTPEASQTDQQNIFHGSLP